VKKALSFFLLLLVLSLAFVSCTKPALVATIALKDVRGIEGCHVAGQDLPLAWKVVTVGIEKPVLKYEVYLTAPGAAKRLLGEGTADGYTIVGSNLNVAGAYTAEVKVTESSNTKEPKVASATFNFSVLDQQAKVKDDNANYFGTGKPVSIEVQSVDGKNHIFEYALDVAENWKASASSTSLIIDQSKLVADYGPNYLSKSEDHILYYRLKDSQTIHNFKFKYDVTGPSITFKGSQRDGTGSTAHATVIPSGSYSLINFTVNESSGKIQSFKIGFRLIFQDGSNIGDAARFVIPGKTDELGYVDVPVALFNTTKVKTFGFRLNNEYMSLTYNTNKNVPLVGADGKAFDIMSFYNTFRSCGYNVTFAIGIEVFDTLGNRGFNLIPFRPEERFNDDPVIGVVTATEAASQNTNIPFVLATAGVKEYLGVDGKSTANNPANDRPVQNGLSYLQIPIQVLELVNDNPVDITNCSTVTTADATALNFSSSYNEKVAITPNKMITVGLTKYGTGPSGSTVNSIASFNLKIDGKGIFVVQIPYEAGFKLTDRNGKTTDGVQVLYTPNIIVLD
jgi:hypothetical protein